MAFFDPSLPTSTVIGPVRSARPYFVDWAKAWTARVIEALLSERVRDEQNERAYRLASKLTWKIYVEKVLKELLGSQFT